MPSGWLQQSGADLFEISGPGALTHLIRSDVTVIVVDPYRLLDVAEIRALPDLLKQRSVIVVNGQTPSRDATSTRLRAVLGPNFTGCIIFTDAQLATKAYDTLRSGGHSPSADVVNEFQRLFLESGVGTAQRLLAELATAAQAHPNLALALARQDVRTNVEAQTEKANQMLRTINSLRTAASAAAMRARHLSVANRAIDGGQIQGSVGASKVDAASRMASAFSGRLGWLSLFLRLRVDDVGKELGREIEGAFSDVERQVCRR